MSIIDPVHRISGDREEGILGRSEVVSPNEIRLAEIRLKWEIAQSPTYGITGLYKDIQRYVKEESRSTGKKDVGDKELYEKDNLDDGFEDQYREALIRCELDRQKERRKMQTFYGTQEKAEKGSVKKRPTVEGRKLATPSSLVGHPFLGISATEGSQSSISGSSFQTCKSSLQKDSEQPTASEESVEETSPAAISSGTHRAPAAGRLFPSSDRHTSTVSQSSALSGDSTPFMRNTSTAVVSSEDGLKLAQDQLLTGGTTLAEAFSGMFDTEGSKRRARKRWEKETRKLEILERMAKTFVTTKTMLAPILPFKLKTEGSLNQTLDFKKDELAGEKGHPFRSLVTNISRIFGWHFGKRYQSFSSLAALRNLSRRAHPVLTLLFCPCQINSFSDAGMLHLMEFEKRKSRKRKLTMFVDSQKEIEQQPQEDRRSEVKKRLSGIWSARVLGDNLVRPAGKNRLHSVSVSPESTREEEMQTINLTDAGYLRLSQRQSKGDTPIGFLDASTSEEEPTDLDLTTVPFLGRLPNTCTTPKFGIETRSSLVSGSSKWIGQKRVSLELRSPDSRTNGPQLLQASQQPDISSLVLPQRESSDQEILTDSYQSDTTSVTSFGSDGNIAENEFHSLLGEIGFARIWQPRLLLYGGAIQRDRELYGRASDYVYESPLYSLVVDYPNPTGYEVPSSSSESESDHEIDEEAARQEFFQLYGGMEEINCPTMIDNTLSRDVALPTSQQQNIPTLVEKTKNEGGMFSLMIPRNSSLEIEEGINTTDAEKDKIFLPSEGSGLAETMRSSTVQLPSIDQRKEQGKLIIGTTATLEQEVFYGSATSVSSAADVTGEIVKDEEQRSSAEAASSTSQVGEPKRLEVKNADRRPPEFVQREEKSGNNKAAQKNLDPQKTKSLGKSKRYIFRLKSELFENISGSLPQSLPRKLRRTSADQAVERSVTGDATRISNARIAYTAIEADQIISEALSGVVRLDFRRATAGTGNNVKTDTGVPSARYGAASVVYRGNLYIFGGVGEGHFKEPVLLNDCWVLSPAVDRTHRRSTVDDGHRQNSIGYMWQELLLRDQTKPPPCAFHLATVHDAYVYIYITQRLSRKDFQDPNDWLIPLMDKTLLDYYDEKTLCQNEYKRAEYLRLKPQVLDIYKKRAHRGLNVVNELWRLDLEAQYPQWEKLQLSRQEGEQHWTGGGIAMNVFGDRLYVYGIDTSSPFVCIGVLDLNLRQWLTWVRLPGAPVWAIAVAIGKLWIILGIETWGIFNFETFEWRCAPAPQQSSIRYGSAATWLPPYLPFLPSFEVSSAQLSRAQLTVKEKRFMFNTSLASQYFWLLQQGRRPADNVHTIILLGGYDRYGRMSNQIDQITVLLPPALSLSCFQPPSKDADLLYASLFGMKLGEERLYGKQIGQHWKNIERSARDTLQRQGEKGVLVEKLLEETRRLREIAELRIAGEERLLQRMDRRFHSRQKELLEQIQDQQDVLNQLETQLKREKRISVKLFHVLQSFDNPKKEIASE